MSSYLCVRYNVRRNEDPFTISFPRRKQLVVVIERLSSDMFEKRFDLICLNKLSLGVLACYVAYAGPWYIQRVQ